MCNRKKVIVMIIKGSISLLRKLFENDMYSISTETGNVVFHPPAVSGNDIIAETEDE